MHRIEVIHNGVTYFGTDLKDDEIEDVKEIIVTAVHPDNKASFHLKQKNGTIYFPYDVVRKSIFNLKKIPLT